MGTLGRIAAFLFMAMLFCGLGWWLGGDLWHDFTHRADKFEPARDAQIVEAKCKSKLFVISFCDVKVKGAGVSGGEREFSYFLLGGVWGDSVAAQRSAGPGPAKDRYLTTTIGIDYLITRIVSFAVLMGLIGAVVIAALIAVIRGKPIDQA
jgi:hypothetical protein